MLKESYESWKKDGVKLEIIFVSSCSNDKEFKKYFEKMGNWLSYEYNEELSRIKSLRQKYNIAGIPTLITIDAKTCAVIDDKARMTVVNHQNEAYKQWIK